MMLSIQLLESAQHVLTFALEKGIALDTPKWMAPVVLFLDLYEKAAIATRRKGVLAAVSVTLFLFAT